MTTQNCRTGRRIAVSWATGLVMIGLVTSPAMTLAGTGIVQAPIAAAPKTTAADRQALIAELERTQKLFLGSIQGLSEAQWAWKSAPDRWSVAEVAEHITLAEGMLRGLITDQVMKAPAPADMLAKTQGKDALVLKSITDRSKKAQAPEQLVPKHTFADEAATVTAFRASRAQTLALAKDVGRDLRSYAMNSQVLNELDAYQWVLFLSAHTERHTKQIEEVKATAGFPGAK
jgi:hypothetical protein